MQQSELDAAIRAHVRMAGRKRLWERSIKIVQTFGSKSVREGSDRVTTTYELSVRVGKTEFWMRQSNFAYGGFYIVVKANDELVFTADETFDTPDNVPYPKRGTMIVVDDDSVMYKNTPRVYITKYVPGTWEKDLDARRVNTSFLRLKKSRGAKAVPPPSAPPQSVSREELTQARELGVAV